MSRPADYKRKILKANREIVLVLFEKIYADTCNIFLMDRAFDLFTLQEKMLPRHEIQQSSFLVSCRN